MAPCRSLSIFLDAICLSLGLATLQEDIEWCPGLPDFRSYFGEIPNLGRRLRVACPCLGIDGAGHALQMLGVPSDMLNCHDLVQDYRPALEQHLRDMGMEHIELNLGSTHGNILNVGLSALRKPIDFLIAGPPCPPWAGNGLHNGVKDVRSRVFVTVIQWVCYLIATGGLLGCILENVIGINTEHDGRESFGSKALRALQCYCPEFNWRIDTVAATDYLLPQTRPDLCNILFC